MPLSKTILVACLALLVTTPAGHAENAVERRLRVLEEQLRRTRQEIEQLRRELEQEKAAQAATGEQAERAEAQAKAVEEGQKRFAPPPWLKTVSLFGDVRARHEAFYHQPHTEGQLVTARHRERIRARVGVRFAYSDELSATIRMASGTPGDPISTNETLTGDFGRKHVNLDWAFVTFAPGASFHVRPGLFSITAGKFPNPIFRVGEMVFDEDLSPEGLSETVAFLGRPRGALDQVKLHVLQWTFAEVAEGQDGWLFGGQVNPQLHWGSAQVEAGVGQYWYLNPDLIAQALNTNSALKNTNLVTMATQAGKTTITGYRSGFNETDVVLAITWPNVLGTQPLRVFADYLYNWQAAIDDAHGVMGGVKLGQTKVRNDWALAGLYEYLGQEAAPSVFTFSDYGTGGTNLQGPVLQADYQLLNPLTLTARTYFTNFIDRPSGMTNPTLVRLQLDALVKF